MRDPQTGRFVKRSISDQLVAIAGKMTGHLLAGGAFGAGFLAVTFLVLHFLPGPHK